MWLTLLLAFLVRVFFVSVFPHYAADGDGPIYETMARNLIHASTFSASREYPLVPSDIRTPGYPIFLGFVYLLLGDDKTTVRLIQALLDTWTCLLVFLLAIQLAPRDRALRTARLALLLAAVCPFTAQYTATVLSETLAIFLSTATVLWVVRGLDTGRRQAWCYGGLLCGLAILTRPDSGLLAAAAGLTLVAQAFRTRELSRLWRQGVMFTLAVGVVLAPWTLRNSITLGKFQPLSARYAEMPGEFVPLGYRHWVLSWIDNNRYEGAAWWNLDTEAIEMDSLPNTAFDSQAEREQVRQLLDAYNQTTTVTPEWDAQFEIIAQQRVTRSPLRYYVWLPLRRSLALWFDPRAELLPVTNLVLPVTQQARADPWDFVVCVLQAAINAAYVVTALGGLYLLRRKPWHFVLLGSALLLRTWFFAAFEIIEPRYMLELYPAVIALAAQGIESWKELPQRLSAA